MNKYILKKLKGDSVPFFHFCDNKKLVMISSASVTHTESDECASCPSLVRYALEKNNCCQKFCKLSWNIWAQHQFSISWSMIVGSALKGGSKMCQYLTLSTCCDILTYSVHGGQTLCYGTLIRHNKLCFS